MLGRQKLIIALLTKIEAPVTRIKLVKLAFLLSRENQLRSDLPFYSFLPFKYGPYSFALARELSALEKLGLIQGDEHHITIADGKKAAAQGIVKDIPTPLNDDVQKICDRYGALTEKSLLRKVYHAFPEFTFNSKLRELIPAGTRRPRKAPLAIYTIGYEGRSIDAFLASIIDAGLRTIIDVRSNPISRKYGFARSTLATLCSKLDLKYVHIPELGISVNDRKRLDMDISRSQLLDSYQRQLPTRQPAQHYALSILQSSPSALLCMESDSALCHRGRLAQELARTSGLYVIHL